MSLYVDLKSRLLQLMDVPSPCKRKTVVAAALRFHDRGFDVVQYARNGRDYPSKVECSNQVGACGCPHAEPKICLSLTRKSVMLCKYSPCTNCANIMVESRLFVGLIYDVRTEHDVRGLDILREWMPCLSLDEIREAEKPGGMRKEEISDIVSRWQSAHREGQ